MSYSRTNNKPSTVYAKEWMLDVHLVPFFGAMKLDAIGPAEIEKYKAGKLAGGLLKKSINNHLTALRKTMNLAVEWGLVDKAPKVRGFNEKHEYVSEDEYLTFKEAERFLRAAAPEWKTFLVLALKTGLRVGELLALQRRTWNSSPATSSCAGHCGTARRGRPRAAGTARCRSRTWRSPRSRRTGTSAGRTSSTTKPGSASATQW